jgi:cobalamin biosynthesis protein CobW
MGHRVNEKVRAKEQTLDRVTRRIPVTIVTGFLGSGKTTLLRGLVQSRQARRLALLINEFGEVAIDGALLHDAAGGDAHVQVHDFAYGLIAYGDDTRFVPAMQALAARCAEIDHVLIETSGLALPTAVMELLQGPQLADDFILDATLAVVDTPLLLAGRFEPAADASSPLAQAYGAAAALFAQQLEYADVVVLNKIDGLDDEALLAAETVVRSRAPDVRFIELAYQARLDIRLALGLRLHQPGTAASVHSHPYVPVGGMPGPEAGVLASHARLNGHAHSGLGAHVHGLATHRHFHEQDPGWMSFVLRSRLPQHPGQVRRALEEAARAEPVLRSKGFIQTADSACPTLVQAVRSRVAISSAEERPAAAISELVFIGYHLRRSRVAAMFTEMTGTLWN